MLWARCIPSIADAAALAAASSSMAGSGEGGRPSSVALSRLTWLSTGGGISDAAAFAVSGALGFGSALAVAVSGSWSWSLTPGAGPAGEGPAMSVLTAGGEIT